MEVHQALVELLAAEGVDTVFTLASEELIAVLSEMEDHRDEDFRVVHCRHEQHAAAMADGYSRVGDGLGVCLVGRGPAVAQTGTALVAASNVGSAVLYVVPETRLGATHDGKGFEQHAFLRSTAGSVESVRSPDVLVPTFADVVRRLRAGDGPVALQLPTDVLDGPFDDTDGLEAYEGTADRSQDARLQPDEARVEAAVEAYLDADATAAPVVIAGRGAVAADAKPAIERLAERLSAYLATSIQAMGYFADHPYDLGFAGDLGTDVANELLGESGFVLAVGCSLNHHTVDEGRLLRDDATVVHVDVDPTHLDRFTEADVGIVGDARATVEALDAALERRDIDRSGAFWTDRVRERLASSSPVSDRAFEERPDRIDPRDLVASLDEVLPADRVVVSDVGHFGGFVFDGLSFGPDDRHLWAADFLALGQGLPLGIGVAMAETDRTCIVCCGDGGLMMSLPALETAARCGVPMVVVVVNDDALGAEYHMGQLRGYSGSVGQVPAPDFASVAASFGLDGHTVRSVEDVEALAGALDGELAGPVVVDGKVNPTVHHRSMGNLSIE